MTSNKNQTGDSPGNPKVPMYGLSHLLLDGGNPRLAQHASKHSSQTGILDLIVETFGIDDVLSSIAVNGYFDSEPMVGIRDRRKSKIRIAEGNRRLAACLILAGDRRAKNQDRRARPFLELMRKHGRELVLEVPVLVYDESEYREALLPYLGVRHIAASQPWDSYAKAVWVAKVLEDGDLTLEEVSQMIGDQHRTVARLLEGYYFVNQLVDTGRFNPRDSHRRGRGSNPEYPFSWIYTTLGYKPVRSWLGLQDLSEGKKKRPVSKGKLGNADDLMVFLLGNKSKARSPAITDSRQIGQLAVAVGEPERLEMLRRGKTIQEVDLLSKPASERVSSGLYDARESLRTVLVPLSQGELPETEARTLTEPSKKVKSLANDVYKRIVSIASGRVGDDG